MKAVKQIRDIVRSGVIPSRKQILQRREDELIKREAKIGREIFGKTQVGQTREFFCLHEHTWIYNETRREGLKIFSQTLRFEILPQGIAKVTDDGRRFWVRGRELQNLVNAMKIYHDRVLREVYRMV